jgi:hypothetical protein
MTFRFSSTEAQGGELGHHLAVDAGLEVEVEFGEGLVHRIAGEAQPSPLAALPGGLHFDGEELLQDLGAGELLLQGPVELDGKVLGGGGHLEVGEMLAEPLVRAGLRGAGGRGHPVPGLLGLPTGARSSHLTRLRGWRGHIATS